MSKDKKAGQKATRQHPPTKILVERHSVGIEKMETVFKRIAEEQITKVEIDGQKIQRLTIHYKFIGALETLE